MRRDRLKRRDDDGIDLRELLGLDTPSLNIHYAGGKVIGWTQQTDFSVALAGAFAIIVGFIGIWDGVAEAHNRSLRRGGVDSYATNSEDLRHAILHEYTGASDLLPLVLFGAVTALAWTSTGRAVFRLNSIEAGRHVASKNGVMQRDFSDIFELKFPTMPWLKWRMRLWKSSLFAVANILLYIGAGISYRAAFSTRSQQLTAPILPSTNVSSLLGCPKSMGQFEKFSELMASTRESAGGKSDFLGYAESLSASDWVIRYGWHQYEFSTSETKIIRQATLRGPFVYQVLQFGGLATENSTIPTFEVALHPQCGNLPYYCLKGSCIWFGVWVGNLDVTISFSGGTVYASSTGYNTLLAAIKCPMKLDRELYRKLVENNQPIAGNENGFFTYANMALTLSYLHANLSLIPDQRPLRELGFIPTKNDTCRTAGNYTGTMFFEIRSNFWPRYQYLACALVIIWGALLSLAAWPFKTFLVRGTLNQYMSFGGDVGSEDMLGTSSGLMGSGSASRWRLVLRNESGCGKMVLEEVKEYTEGDRESCESPRLRFGTKWI